MIPSKPRVESEILLVQTPEEIHNYPETDDYHPDVVIVVGFHTRSQPLRRCLDSIVSLHARNLKLLVIIGNDSKEDISDLTEVYKRCIPITTLNILAGKAAQSRNMLLDYIDYRFKKPLWVARLDADDELASPDALFQLVEQGESNQVDFVIGGNLLRIKDEIIGINKAQVQLKSPSKLLQHLKEMADGTAQNELPSCNLLMRSHSGVRYPHHHSAEDHWLLTELLIHKNNQVHIAEEIIYAIYRLDGCTTNINQSENRYHSSRLKLYQTALHWQTASNCKGRLLGFGNEGIVYVKDDFVIKQFYEDTLSEEDIRWLNCVETSNTILPKYKMYMKEDRWFCKYPYVTTTPFITASDVEQVEKFLLNCLKHNLAPLNIKRDNLRITSNGDIQYIDIGKDIKPLTASAFLDISARLYAIGILNVPDSYVFRYTSKLHQHEALEQLPGFAEFYKQLMLTYSGSLLKNEHDNYNSITNEVTLLIKCCAMDADFVDEQIPHIINSLEKPVKFAKTVILIDSFEGPFLREYAKGDLTNVINACEKLKSIGLVDEIWLFPKSDELNQSIYKEWFNCNASHSHTQKQVPVASQLWAFDKVETRYVLQCDLDVLIGRRDYTHNYLGEILDALRQNSNAFCCGFNIPKAPSGRFESYCAPDGSYVPEVRLGLLDLIRIKSQRPFPNSVVDDQLTTSWYRSIEQYQKKHGWKSLRGGSPSTFYIHPPNHIKKDLLFLKQVRQLCEMGQVPSSQFLKWDLEYQPDNWSCDKRHESIVFLIKGRNTPLEKVNRCFTSLKVQNDQDFGVIIIDDASNDGIQRHYPSLLGHLQPRTSLLIRNTRVGRMPNFITGIKDVCQNSDSLIVILDMDDALIHPSVVSKLKQKTADGHDLIQAGVFRPDKPLKQYKPVYSSNIRHEYGNDSWSHLRSFKKALFDKIPESYFQINEKWIEECTDYATMIPLVELAAKPFFIDQFFYLHERSTISPNKKRKAELIKFIVEKKPICLG